MALDVASLCRRDLSLFAAFMVSSISGRSGGHPQRRQKGRKLGDGLDMRQVNTAVETDEPSVAVLQGLNMPTAGSPDCQDWRAHQCDAVAKPHSPQRRFGDRLGGGWGGE